jgi:hypothetical protein
MWICPLSCSALYLTPFCSVSPTSTISVAGYFDRKAVRSCFTRDAYGYLQCVLSIAVAVRTA